MASSPIIHLEHVSLSFGPFEVLKDVNLSVEEGTCLVLVGPSGQGKTSLLKMIAGLISPSSGEIFIESQNTGQLSQSDSRALFLKMGMLFQKNALFDSMTVMENILFPMTETTNKSEKEKFAVALRRLKEVGLDHVKDHFPHEISGGMQKRLGIARALALGPEIILYDDPTAGLDPITSRKIAALLKDLTVQNSVTSVVVTNDMMRAFQLADQIAFVWNQQVQMIGNCKEAQLSTKEPFRSFLRGEGGA